MSGISTILAKCIHFCKISAVCSKTWTFGQKNWQSKVLLTMLNQGWLVTLTIFGRTVGWLHCCENTDFFCRKTLKPNSAHAWPVQQVFQIFFGFLTGSQFLKPGTSWFVWAVRPFPAASWREPVLTCVRRKSATPGGWDPQKLRLLTTRVRFWQDYQE